MKFWKTFLLVTVPYAFLMSVFKIVTGDFALNDFGGVLLASIFFGAMFTVAMIFFVRYQMKRIVVDLEPEEKVIKEGGANRILNLEGIGGKLVLTDKRLIFKSHKLNLQNHQLSLPLSEIESVEAGKTGFLNNVLMVHQNDGASSKFIVFEPGDWVKDVETNLGSV